MQAKFQVLMFRQWPFLKQLYVPLKWSICCGASKDLQSHQKPQCYSLLWRRQLQLCLRPRSARFILRDVVELDGIACVQLMFFRVFPTSSSEGVVGTSDLLFKDPSANRISKSRVIYLSELVVQYLSDVFLSHYSSLVDLRQYRKSRSNLR